MYANTFLKNSHFVIHGNLHNGRQRVKNTANPSKILYCPPVESALQLLLYLLLCSKNKSFVTSVQKHESKISFFQTAVFSFLVKIIIVNRVLPLGSLKFSAYPSHCLLICKKSSLAWVTAADFSSESFPPISVQVHPLYCH